jgi:hypothetical protein
MGVHGAQESDQYMLNQFPVQWYAVCGIVAGCLAFLVGISVLAYKCYQKRTYDGPDSRPLNSAIIKGLKESNNGSMKQSPSLKSMESGKSRGSMGSGGGGGPLLQGQQPGDVSIPEKGGRKGSATMMDATQLKTECYIENENGGALSPQEKEVQMREKSVDELKIRSLGHLHFTVEYDKLKTALIVTIVRATDLPAKDPNVGSSDPYIKLQLLPEKRHKVKTRVLRKTLNPIYDEIFTFYGINYNQLAGITLHFVALSFDRFSRDDIIGEVVCPLSGMELGEKEVTVSKEIAPRHIKIHSHGRGELLVSLCYQPAANRLTVVVLKARNLPKMDITGLSDPYVKIYLLYNGQRIAKKKTHVKKRTLNPVFNESFLFDVPCNEGLQNISLEFMVLDWDRMTKNEIIGRLEVGATFDGPESHHWNEVMNCPRKQIAEWHKLKE